MSKTDGYLKIKTKIDNSGVDKGIAELENKINKLQTQNQESRNEENALQKEIDKYEELQIQAEEYRNTLNQLKIKKDEMYRSNPNLAVSVDTPEYTNVKNEIEEIRQKYQQATTEIDKQATKMDKVYAKLDKVKSKQNENNAKISQFKDKIESIKLNNVQDSLNNVGNSIQSQIKKVGKMTLAIFGIRTAFSAVHRAMNTVAQYNPKIAADFEYMSYCISNILAPAVQWLSKLLYTVLGYVNAIMNAWFGINIFSNSSVKNFQKMKNSASAAAKATKEMQKSTQGFDDMNIVPDNSSNSGSSSGGGMPSTDLSMVQAEIPEWLKWIIDNKELVLSILAGILGGLISLKVLGLDPILNLGIGVTIAGIAKTIQSIIKFINDPSWENFIDILEGISIALIGIGVIVGTVTGGWIALVIGVLALIVTEIIKYWDEIMEILRTNRTVDI